MQIGQDPRQRRSDDRLIEGGQEQGQQDRGEDLEPRPRVDVNWGVVDGRWRGGLDGGGGHEIGSPSWLMRSNAVRRERMEASSPSCSASVMC